MSTLHRKTGFGLPTKFRIAAVVAVLIAACTHLFNTGYADWNAGADTAYVMLLLWLFFSKERLEDERVRELKLKAMFVAFVAGWAVAGVLRFISYLQDRSVPPRTLSSYDVMFAMLLIAHALFQFWRYQDGRQLEAAPQ